MNAQVPLMAYPPAAQFVRLLCTRVQSGYPQAMATTTRALVQAGTDRSEMLTLVGNAATFGSFLICCCA